MVRKIFCKVTGKNLTFGRQVKNGTILECEHIANDRYRIPKESEHWSKNRKFAVELFESGGGMTNTGIATIVSGMNGEPMKPLAIFKRGHLSNAKHAMFCIEKCFQITSNRDGHISFRYIGTEVFEEIGELILVDELVWRGPIEELPEMYQQFQVASEVAMAKANIYHCREAMYVEN